MDAVLCCSPFLYEVSVADPTFQLKTDCCHEFCVRAYVVSVSQHSFSSACAGRSLHILFP